MNPDALARFESIVLQHGAHLAPEYGMCAMEAVAFVAGEPFSDHPKCASPVLGAFMRTWNDGLLDKDRTRLLKPYVLRLVGTRGTEAQEETRAWMACDWLVRVYTPTWLELAGMKKHAAALRQLPPIVSDETAAAARDAAGYAARDAARDTAGYAARAAARDATGYAARDAARYAARAAARAAAGEKVAPTVAFLQKSACGLLDAMIAVTSP